MKIPKAGTIRTFLSEKSRSFLYKFAVYFLLCNMILILFASTLYYKNAERIIFNSSYQYTYTIMKQAQQNFDTYIDTHITILDSIAENDWLLSAYLSQQRGEIDNTSLYISRVSNYIKDFRNTHPDIIDVLVVTDNDLIINRDAAWGVNWNYPFFEAPWYQEALAVGKNSPPYIFYMVTDFYYTYSSQQTQPVVVLARPVYNYLQQKIGAVFYMIYLDSFWTSVLNGYHSQYGDLIITNQAQQIIAHSRRGDEGNTFANIDSAISVENEAGIKKPNMEDPFLLLLPSQNTACNIVCSMNVNIDQETTQLLRSMILVILLFIVLNLIILIYLSNNFNQPVQHLVEDLKSSSTAEQKKLSGNYRFLELTFIADNFNELLQNIFELNEKQTEMAIALQKAKNDVLISKINPHFLFNSLQLIQTENLYGSKEKTNEIILSLSNQLRYNIYDDSNNLVPLSRELERVQDYLQLCSAIYEDQLQIFIDIQPALLEYRIPKFTLHMLAENSIKHGFGGTPENGIIRITGISQENEMILTVTDNGIGIPAEKLQILTESLKNGTHTGIGLQNLTKQLEYFFGSSCSVQILSSDGETAVTLRIPCITSEPLPPPYLLTPERTAYTMTANTKIPVLIGIDAGSTHLKTAIYSLSGKCLDIIHTRVNVYHSQPDFSEFHPEEIFAALCRNLNTLLANRYTPTAVGISSFGESIVPVDKNGAVLDSMIAWFDMRGQALIDSFAQHFGPEALFSLTGQYASGKFTLAKLLWLKANKPALLKKADGFLFMQDYLSFCLTGLRCTEFSLASRSMLFDIRHVSWSEELLAACGVTAQQMPAVIPSGTSSGTVTAEAAALTGLPEGIPVVLAGHDHACASVAAGILDSSVVLDSLGTSETCIFTGQTPNMDALISGNVCTYPYYRDTYRFISSIQGCGASIEWMANLFFREEPFVHFFEKADSGSKTSHPAPLILPFLRGLQEAPSITGNILNLKDFHGQEDFCFSLLEGLCLEYNRRITDAQKSCNLSVKKIRAAGRLSKEPVFMQLKADITGLPVEILSEAEAVSQGAAVLAGLCCGLIQDWKPGIEKVYFPDSRKYQDGRRFQEYLHRLQLFFS